MSDEIDLLFHRLRGQRPPGPFAAPEAVRRRGRQRSQHQALAAGLAVVAMAGGGGAGLASVASVDRSVTPSPTVAPTAPSASPSTMPLPSITPSASPSPTTDPSATALPGPGDLSTRMLRPADLGPGSWRPRQPQEPFEGDLWHWTSACSAYDSADYPSLRRQADLDVTGFAAGASLESPYVFEHVHRYAAGWGPRALDDVRRAVRVCPNPPDPRRTVVRTGFAGDEALLVREEFAPVGAPPFVTLTAVVRVGDLVATVMFSPDRDERYAQSVATAAAQRLAGG